jgi:hypothetical protein
MPGLWESLALGAFLVAMLLAFRPEWALGGLFGLGVGLGTRAIFTRVALGRPQYLALVSLGKQLSLAGLALMGILLGLHPVGVVLGIAVWPLSLWTWVGRRVRDR